MAVVNAVEIPVITHPLGRHWDQPSRDAILLDLTHALMTETTFKALREYSATMPTGVYEGKMWRRHDGIYADGLGRVTEEARAKAKWLLCWYGPGTTPGTCLVHYREILLVEVKTVWA